MGYIERQHRRDTVTVKRRTSEEEMGQHDDRHEIEEHDLGLSYDLQKLAEQTLKRRRFLQFAGVATLLPIIGCGDDSSGTGGTAGTAGSAGGTAGTSGTSGTGGSTGSCTMAPDETEGPYPGDGSNGPNVLTESGIVRSDIRSSIGSASGTADGIETTVTLTLVDTNNSCAALSGYAIYLWHCDALGRYSLYSAGATDQNYLRGVQETNSAGQVTFTTIFPACYDGRWPHMHFEVYESLAKATTADNKIWTSQLGMPEAACNEVYTTSAYTGSSANFANVSYSSDMVFQGNTTELANVTGDTSSGYAVTLTVGL
ncbi:MAG: hypothetical protein R3A47_10915 [Polyangiales bacterium]